MTTERQHAGNSASDNMEQNAAHVDATRVLSERETIRQLLKNAQNKMIQNKDPHLSHVNDDLRQAQTELTNALQGATTLDEEKTGKADTLHSLLESRSDSVVRTEMKRTLDALISKFRTQKTEKENEKVAQQSELTEKQTALENNRDGLTPAEISTRESEIQRLQGDIDAIDQTMSAIDETVTSLESQSSSFQTEVSLKAITDELRNALTHPVLREQESEENESESQLVDVEAQQAILDSMNAHKSNVNTLKLDIIIQKMASIYRNLQLINLEKNLMY